MNTLEVSAKLKGGGQLTPEDVQVVQQLIAEHGVHGAAKLLDNPTAPQATPPAPPATPQEAEEQALQQAYGRPQ